MLGDVRCCVSCNVSWQDKSKYCVVKLMRML